MAIGTLTLMAATGFLFLLKLAVMALVVVLLAKTLFANRKKLVSPAVMARVPRLAIHRLDNRAQR